MAYERVELSLLNPDAQIELWEVDVRIWGGSVYRYHNVLNNLTNDQISFDSNTYTALPIVGSGFEYSGQGPMPTPKVSLGNVGYAITTLAFQYKRFQFCSVCRIMTLRKHLDDGSDPDAVNLMHKDIFYVDRITSMNNAIAEFALSTNLAALRAKLPADLVDAERFPGTQYAGFV